MATKKTVKRKKMAKAGRPKGKTPSYVYLGLRCTSEESKLIRSATNAEAARRHVVASQNNFCLRAALSASKKELGLPDDFVVTEDY